MKSVEKHPDFHVKSLLLEFPLLILNEMLENVPFNEKNLVFHNILDVVTKLIPVPHYTVCMYNNHDCITVKVRHAVP